MRVGRQLACSIVTRQNVLEIAITKLVEVARFCITFVPMIQISGTKVNCEKIKSLNFFSDSTMDMLDN